MLAVSLLYPIHVRSLEWRVRKYASISPPAALTRPATSGVGAAVGNIVLIQLIYTAVLWYGAVQTGTLPAYTVVLLSTALKAYAVSRTFRVLKHSILEFPPPYTSFHQYFFWSYLLLPVSLAFDAAAFITLTLAEI